MINTDFSVVEYSILDRHRCNEDPDPDPTLHFAADPYPERIQPQISQILETFGTTVPV